LRLLPRDESIGFSKKDGKEAEERKGKESGIK
jgi:hypothetical protein